MTLLIAVFAAIICTILWYRRKDDTMKLGTLCFMYWGASLMWLGDAIFEYLELGAEYFTPAPTDMPWLNPIRRLMSDVLEPTAARA